MTFAELLTYRLGQRGPDILIHEGLYREPIGTFAPAAAATGHAQKIIPEILPAFALLDLLVAEVDMTYPDATELAVDWPELHRLIAEARALLKRAGAA